MPPPSAPGARLECFSSPSGPAHQLISTGRFDWSLTGARLERRWEQSRRFQRRACECRQMRWMPSGAHGRNKRKSVRHGFRAVL